MYCVMAPFGVFVCSACAGIHRELNNKVKGISMSNFSDAECAFLKQWGNKNQQAQLMGNWSEKRNPIPEKKDATKFKDFMVQKYQNKQFSLEAAVDSSDDDSDSDSKKKKKSKKSKKDKKKAKKKQDSSDDDDSEPEPKKKKKESKKEPDSSDEEIVVAEKVKQESKKGSRKLGAPPGFKPTITQQQAPVQAQVQV